MSALTNIATLQTLLGLTNYYNIYVPKLKASLRNWFDKYQKSFEDIKNMLISESWLTHFNPDSEKLVAADASDYGIVEVMS